MLARLKRPRPALEGNLEQADPDAPRVNPSILDAYVTTPPSPKNAVDVFAGEWASILPPPLSDLTGGFADLFDDARVTWAVDQLGGVAGRTVLELGPLEGGHTYGLVRHGASVTAIEANTRAYLKCLIAKELLNMSEARFLLGDFMEYLRGDPDHVDVCFASGVLYHMRNPVETLALTADMANRLFLWTHFYDHDAVHSSESVSSHFKRSTSEAYQGFTHTLHHYDYEQALASPGFCGGSAAYSNWLTRADLLAALAHVGWNVDEIGFETLDHPHGPALALVASRNQALGR